MAMPRSAASAFSATYQIRVDGLTDVGLPPTTWEETSGGNAVLYATSAYTIELAFNDLAPGAHIIELHLRGSAGTCTHNTGDFGHVILVTEERVSTNSSLSPLMRDGAGEPNGGGEIVRGQAPNEPGGPQRASQARHHRRRISPRRRWHRRLS